jgi:natural product precursor
MKRVKNLIKLTTLNSGSLNEKELNHVLGGGCYCGCFYENCGGSSTGNNDSANTSGGKSSVLRNPAQWG